MSANQKQIERLQVVVSRAEKKRIRLMAKKSNCSVSELVRRATAVYNVDDDDQEIHNSELEALVEAVKEGIRRANKATDRAEREVRATIDFYKARAQAREARG